MQTLAITYIPWIKNRARGATKYYARVNERGQKVYDIPLGTEDPNEAEQWCALRRQEVELYNSYIRMGERPPESVSRRVVRRSSMSLQSTDGMTIMQAIDGYMADCRRRGLRQASMDSYCRFLRVMYTDWTQPMQDFTVSLVETIQDRYIHLAQETRRAYANCLRQFASYWMRRRDMYDDKVIEAIRHVKVDRRAHGVWTMEEMTRICEAGWNFPSRVYYHVLRVTACRGTELMLAKWSDLRDGYIVLRAEYTKGRKARPLPLTQEVLRMLEELRGTALDDCRIFADLPMSNSARNRMLKQACRTAGVSEGSLHKFRHSAATHYFRKGVDIKTVSQLLGHASETTTIGIYLEATSAEVMANKILGAL